MSSASVVVPAHDEEAVLGRCLTAIAAADVAAGLEVVVVANGCRDRTVEVARAFADRLPGLVVLDRPEPGKAGALNAGDAVATAYPRIYLDADIELGPGALDALVAALDTDRALVAAPGVVLDTAGAGPVPRAFFDVFRRLPYARDGLVGLGVYGLSAAGRARFDTFPDVTADDLFVQQLFAARERVTTSGTFRVRVPRTAKALVRVRTRGALGPAELRRLGLVAHPLTEESTSTGRALAGLLLRTPRLAPAVAAYVGVGLLARWHARTSTARWLRDESTREPVPDGSSPGRRPVRVAYLVSHYPSVSHVFIEREVEGLRALGAEVETFSVRSVPRAQLLSAQMRAEADRTVTLLDDRALVARAALATTLRHPRAVLHALRQAARTGPRSPRARLWQLFYLLEAVRLHRELARRGLRHLHVHFANNGADVARLVVALGRAVDGPDAGWRWTLSMHGPTEFEEVERFDLPAKVRSADAVACISDFTRSQLMRLTEPEHWDKLHLVRMSVDVDRYVPPPSRRHDGPLRVLFVGRLVPEKGPGVLLDAVRRLLADGVEVDVRIVGDGRLRQVLADRVTTHGLTGAVRLLGAVGQDEMPGHFGWADVFCLPSFQEGLPVVLMEAMASGIPVVTTGINGIPELVADGVTGRVVVPGRADLVAKAIAGLAGATELRESWGRAGRAVVEKEFATTVTSRDQLDFLAPARARG